jgi:putative phosphoribosyl transferase
MITRFKDRYAGGQSLAHLLVDYAGRKDVLVLGIPPGGVPVAAAIAQSLECAMDVLTVRTLNVPQHDPWQLEIPMGAVTLGGVRVVDYEVVTSARVQSQELEQVVAFERQELERLHRLYRGDRPFADLRGRTVIVATDAIITGSVIDAAARAIRANGAARVLAATPVGLTLACEHVQRIGAEFVCLHNSRDYCSPAVWYDDPREPTYQEIRALLAPHLRHDNDPAPPLMMRNLAQ